VPAPKTKAPLERGTTSVMCGCASTDVSRGCRLRPSKWSSRGDKAGRAESIVGIHIPLVAKGSRWESRDLTRASDAMLVFRQKRILPSAWGT